MLKYHKACRASERSDEVPIRSLEERLREIEMQLRLEYYCVWED